MKKTYLFILFLVISLIIYSCANKGGGPTGGPKDETPPRVMKSFPANGSVNFKKKEIKIIFDENISVVKATENVLISPPQLKQPEVKGDSKIVSISFEDDLLDSTTYTINFGDAIVDLNENNPIKNYRFAFSTGNQIDTMKIAGKLINAEDLNPMADVYVGIYEAQSDSVFFTKPFLRIGKTDAEGNFVIDNVRAGKYKIFALGDTNKDFYYNPGEGLAFSDSLLSPTVNIEEMRDTIWADSVTVDSVRTYMGARFLPDSILLRYFKENKKRQYFVKSERKQAQSFNLYFNTIAAQVPVIKPINFKWDGKYLLQKNATLDSLTYWITDKEIINTDTLNFELTYQKTDSLFEMVSQTDTISVFMRKPKVNPKSKVVKTEPKKEFYKFTANASASFDLYNPIVLRFDSPLDTVDFSKIKLEQKIDSVLKSLPVKWRQLDSSFMNYAIDYKWIPEKSYSVTIDSAAFRSIYNLDNEKYTSQFKIKSLEEYSSIKLKSEKFDSLLIFQVLDTKDVVLASKKAVAKGTLFEYLKPGDYYVRAFVDANRNGKWDTGNILKRLHPEDVYYYSKKLTLKANWEFEETWDVYEIPLLDQKPSELKKDGNKKPGE